MESPCLREACKVSSAPEIAVNPYSHLVGMFYRPSKNVSPSPDSMLPYDAMLCYCYFVMALCFLLTPCNDYMSFFDIACECLLCFPIAYHSIQHKMNPL